MSASLGGNPGRGNVCSSARSLVTGTEGAWLDEAPASFHSETPLRKNANCKMQPTCSKSRADCKRLAMAWWLGLLWAALLFHVLPVAAQPVQVLNRTTFHLRSGGKPEW